MRLGDHLLEVLNPAWWNLSDLTRGRLERDKASARDEDLHVTIAVEGVKTRHLLAKMLAILHIVSRCSAVLSWPPVRTTRRLSRHSVACHVPTTQCTDQANTRLQPVTTTLATMTGPSAETPRVRTLAAALRHAREATNPVMSKRAVARAVGVSNTTVGRWEDGEDEPSAENLEKFLDAVGVTGATKAHIFDLAQRSTEADWLTSGPPGISQQLAGVMECERTCVAATNWSPFLIPGGLQTDRYARSILSQSPDLSPAEIETQVTLRMGRRNVFTRQRDPIELVALIGLQAISGRIGDDSVMAEQLEHLLETCRNKDNITVQLVPLMGAWHEGFAGQFVIYEFQHQADIVYQEHLFNGAFLSDSKYVKAYKSAADKLRRVAMSPTESEGHIANVLTSLEKKLENT